MQTRARVQVKVWGEYGCFTRPEFKVERVSYPLITPSAARGVLEAIFWKPEFRYEILRIGVTKPVKQEAILRNELMHKQSGHPLVIENDRAQRTSLILKDVAYWLVADIVLRPRARDPVFKYRDQFNRRVQRGQCHHTPYLGTREYSAYFAPIEEDASLPTIDIDVGTMLFDMAFIADDTRKEMEFLRHEPTGRRIVSGYAQPLFFQARVDQGWMTVPQEKYTELYRMEGEDVI